MQFEDESSIYLNNSLRRRINNEKEGLVQEKSRSSVRSVRSAKLALQVSVRSAKLALQVSVRSAKLALQVSVRSAKLALQVMPAKSLNSADLQSKLCTPDWSPARRTPYSLQLLQNIPQIPQSPFQFRHSLPSQHIRLRQTRRILKGIIPEP